MAIVKEVVEMTCQLDYIYSFIGDNEGSFVKEVLGLSLGEDEGVMKIYATPWDLLVEVGSLYEQSGEHFVSLESLMNWMDKLQKGEA